MFNTKRKEKGNDIERAMQEIDNVLKYHRVNPVVLETLIDYIRQDLSSSQAIMIAFEKPTKKRTEGHFRVGGYEPGQLIVTASQLLFRVQHEGLPGYD